MNSWDPGLSIRHRYDLVFKTQVVLARQCTMGRNKSALSPPRCQIRAAPRAPPDLYYSCCCNYYILM
ncbi:hypothetical protein EVAR_32235_1 [Eumeta japonica]|uniref:Uncharacterized protein n=1 Tax=Eumeta variegata TaxID=151549 RepID=A0A4C1YLV0_EUMVA|nr:hypothetical protein EVAR_32235_1 [Eumeta japonica]